MMYAFVKYIHVMYFIKYYPLFPFNQSHFLLRVRHFPKIFFKYLLTFKAIA